MRGTIGVGDYREPLQDGVTGVTIMRPTVFGNPHKLEGKKVRLWTVKNFHAYLQERWLHPGDQLTAEVEKLAHRVMGGETISLLCCCKPKLCHGDVLMYAVERLMELWEHGSLPPADFDHLRWRGPRARRRVIVAGGREFQDYGMMEKCLDGHFEETGWDAAIIEGEARGADKLAARYADERGMPCEKFPAFWDELGPIQAGPERNGRMADHASLLPDGELVAFWDTKTRGTKDMIGQARQRRLRTTVFNY